MSAHLLMRMAGVDPESERGRALAAGLSGPQPGEEAWGALVVIAEQYLQAGGIWTPREWAGLTRIERAACVAAGERRDAQRALAVANAIKSDLGAAAVAEVLDGGAAKAEVAEAVALDALRSKIFAQVAQRGES